ncbi:DUF1622 domain-containing protein [Xanthobacter pseudotagetidis]|uniref:DUF1622 domain-containing protein n=1 Tax=Xanthobacter pseudotagetidis TaxID=3119911 RepID=UPI00372671B4
MDTLANEILHWTTRAIEVAGTAVIVYGILSALVLLGRGALAGRTMVASFRQCRSSLGMAILLGLEFLVAADIINTVAIEPSLQSLAVLAGIVLVRTFLSFSLEIEIEGRWPWQRAQAAASPADEEAPAKA